MGSSIPDIVYNSVNKRFELRGRHGSLKAAWDDGNRGALIHEDFFTGSSAALAAIGTQTRLTGTITNSTGVKVGDMVVCNIRSAISGQVMVGNFRVPSNNLINFDAINTDAASAGSLPATGWIVNVRRYQ